MEAEKSRDLHLEAGDSGGSMVELQSEGRQAWHPRVADVQVWVWRLGKTHVSAQRVRQRSSLWLTWESWLFCFIQAHWWGPPSLGRTISFTQHTGSNVNLTHKHPHKHMQKDVGPNVWAPGSWHIKLTTTSRIYKIYIGCRSDFVCICTRSHTYKDSTGGLMLCCCYLEILDNF